MDRTAEFSAFLKKSLSEERIAPKKKFYEEIYENIQKIHEDAASTASYKVLLNLDKKLDELVKKSTTLFDNLEINGPNDLQMHLEGIKMITNRKLVEASKRLALSKAKAASLDVDLKPQRPATFKRIAENQVLEQETKSIVESVQYEETRQRLLKIEAVQRAIYENLTLQDEHIDHICTSYGVTSEVYEKLSGDFSINTGSFFKRATGTIIFCLAFVLAFLHCFYRSK